MNYTSKLGISQRLIADQSDTIVLSGPAGAGWAAPGGYETIVVKNLHATAPLSFTITGGVAQGGAATTVAPRSKYEMPLPSGLGATLTVVVTGEAGKTNGYSVSVVKDEVDARPPYQWLSGPAKDQIIPTGVWTPLLWPRRNAGDLFITDRGLDAVTTTIAAASNLAILPQGTINVADTTGFPTPIAPAPEYAAIFDVSADAWQIVRYTGKTATTLTGCTLGSITLATGDTVIPASVSVFGMPPAQNKDYYLLQMVTSLIWQSSAAGTIRRTRYNAQIPFGPVWVDFLVFGNDDAPINAPAPGQRCQMTGQPGLPQSDGTGIHAIEVFQDTGADLRIIASGAEAPIVMQSYFAGKQF